jgi:hypothetical protein
MEKVKVILAFLPIALLLAVVCATNAAPVRTPGVSVGNTFQYGNASFYWYSNDPTATIPTEWESLNGTAYALGTVENVVGTNVTMSLLLHYNNGTETTQNGWVDVDTGDGENLTLFLISANLNPGDPIYSNGTYSSYTINETVSTTYPGGSRDTNHFNMTMEESIPPTHGIHGSFSLSMDMYWDRATGVLTKLYMESNSTITYTTFYSVSMGITQSNVWVVPEFVGLPLTLPLFASLALVTIAYTRKLRKTENH